MTIRPHVRPDASGEDGFTIIEVMVAMLILLIGVLGTFTLMEGSLSSTARTSAREQGTNLASDLVERSHQVAYDNMTLASAPATLRSSLPASDNVGPLSGSSFTVTRRNTTYGVTVFACSIDDPSDGAGQGDATFCLTPTVPPAPGAAAPGVAASVNVLGIGVSVGGSLLQTVCNAAGLGTIGSMLSAGLSSVAPLSVCPSGSAVSVVGYDPTPDDLRRVRIDVSWTKAGHKGSLSQTTLLTNPNQS